MITNLVRPPVRTRATPNITPFTYYDGLTYLEILEALRSWLRDSLVPEFNELAEYVDDEIAAAIATIEDTLAAKIDEIDQMIADQNDHVDQEIADLTAYVDDAVQQVINSAIEVQDPVMQGILADTESLTREYTDSIYSRVKQVPPVAGDATATINAALAGGGTVRLTPGESYDLSEAVAVESGTVLDLAGATVNRTGSGGAITVSGAVSDTVFAVSGDISRGDESITLAGASDIVAGDYIRIISDETLTMPSSQGTAVAAEFARVISVTGNVLDIANPVSRAYLESENARISRVDFAEDITITGGTIVGDGSGGNRGVSVSYGRNVRVDNVTVRATGSSAIGFGNCLDVSASGVNIYDIEDNLAGGATGYGINVSGITDGLTVTGCNVNGGRHAFTTTAAGYGPSRRISVTGCTATGMAETAFDTHVTADAVVFSGCVVDRCLASGFTLRGTRSSVIGCEVSNVSGHGVSFPENGGADNTVTGSVFVDVAGSGVRVSGSQPRPIVSNNTFIRCAVAGVSFEWASVYPTVSNNLFIDCAPDGGAMVRGISGQQILSGNIVENTFVNRTSGTRHSVSIPLSNSATAVSNNTLRGVFGPADGTSTDIVYSGNLSASGRNSLVSGYSAIGSVETMEVADGSSGTVTVNGSAPAGGDPSVYEIVVTSINAARARIIGRATVFLQRDSGNAFGDISSIDRIDGSIGADWESGSYDIVLSIVNISASGFTFGVRATNNSGSAQSVKVSTRRVS